MKKHLINDCGAPSCPSGLMVGASVELGNRRVEDIFNSVICDEVCEIIFKDFHDKRLGKKMLRRLLSDQIAQLVMEIENDIAERIASDFKRMFDIEGEVDYTHAAHAKLSTLFKTLKLESLKPTKK